MKTRRAFLATVVVALPLLLAFRPPADSITARYELRFDASWSASTHPDDFPSNPHFSGLVGGTHDSGADFWSEGDLASLGIERMAEWGSKTDLLAEVDAEIGAGRAFSRVDGPGIPTSPGSAVVEFDAHRDFPLATVVSMVAPSPDWFVGTDALDLRPGGNWAEQLVVSVYVLDAGTDSGTSYESPDADTQPREPISYKTDGPFATSGLMGSFTFTRVDTPEAVPSAGAWALIALALLLSVAMLRRPAHR